MSADKIAELARRLAEAKAQLGHGAQASVRKRKQSPSDFLAEQMAAKQLRSSKLR